MCDDENVEPLNEADIVKYFGDHAQGSGYVLFYQAADLDLASLGLKSPPPPKAEATFSDQVGVGAFIQPFQMADSTPLKLQIPDDKEKEAIKAPAPAPATVVPPASSALPSPAPTAPIATPVSAAAAAPMPLPVATPISPTPAPATVPLATTNPVPVARVPSVAASSVSSVGRTSGTVASSPSLDRYSATPSKVVDTQALSPKPIKESGGGNWFSRRTGKDKGDDKKTRISVYEGESTSTTASERSSVAPTPVYHRADSGDTAKARQPSAPALLESLPATRGLGLTTNENSQGSLNGSTSNMSSSVMSSISAASVSTSSTTRSAPNAPPAPPPGLGSLGRKNSQAQPARDRQASNGSASSSYGGGGGLGRRLSGAVGGKSGLSLTRSSSAAFKSMGFGRNKDKDKDKDEKKRAEEERKGLLG